MRQIKSLLVDIILVAIATLLALYLRDNLEFNAARVELLLPYLVISLLAAAVILPMSGVTRTLWRFSGVAEYRRLVVASICIVLAAVMVCFAFNRLDKVMRSLPIVQFLIMVVFLVGVRLAGRAHRFRNRRHTAEVLEKSPEGESVLVLGLNAVAELFLQSVAEHGGNRISVAGVIGRNERQTGATFRSHKVLGVPEDIVSIIKELEVHGVMVERIVVTVAFEQLSDIAKEALLDIENGSQIKVDFFAERLGFAQRPVKDQLMTTEDHGPVAPAAQSIDETRRLSEALQRPYWKVKRGFDALLAAGTIFVLLPVMLAIGLLTAMTVGLPVLFWQQRPGRYGQPFKVYKFRSLLGAHDETGRRLPDELRQTPFGHFLRATRLDELPQLFNILRGHMSFVGPRPLLDVDQLEDYRDRLWVRPGLTGWAQVNGGKSVSASDKMVLDMWYIHNASLALDFKIVFLTVKTVVLGEQTNKIAVDQARMELSRRH